MLEKGEETVANPSNDQSVLDDQESGGKGASAGSKKRGLARLILGTIFLNIALMGIAVNASRLGTDSLSYGLFFAALGTFLLWWGAHGRLGWMRPLGITWIVFGVLSLLSMTSLQRAASESGGAFRGSAWLLLGGGAMIAVGSMLLFRAQKGRSAS